MIDAKKLQYYLNSPLMQRIVELKERGFADKDQYEDAPVNFDDAIENYKRVIDITADVAQNIVGPTQRALTSKVRILRTTA